MRNLFVIGLVFWASAVMAVDRIVEEFGVAPAYSSISAAVAAAEDGDRIIIKNRAGDIPWIEDITVNKSLEFHSYADNGFFVVQGAYVLQKAANRVIKIVGMQNTSGSITRTGSNIANSSMEVYIMDSHFINGHISMSDHGIIAHIVGNTFDSGYVHIAHGNVIGNDIDAAGTNNIAVNLNSSVSFMEDTALVVGNIINTQASTSYYGIQTLSTAQAVHIRNNFITANSTIGIYARQGNISAVQNIVWNNTVKCVGTSSRGINIFDTNTGSIWEIMNNVIVRQSGSNVYAIYNGGSNDGQVNVYWNHIGSGFTVNVSNGFTFSGNNTTGEVLTINEDGTFDEAPSAIDGGNPAPVFYDLDLSPGDPGAYGGSFTLNNFHPLHTGAARVYHVNFPFNVRVGSTLNVKAYSYDR